MNTINPAFGPATVRAHQILYCCDLGRDGGGTIPLGVMADLRVQGVYGLGLVARDSLTAQELGSVGRLLRPEFVSPFQYLSKLFEDIFNSSDPATDFARLPEVHAYSLRFSSLLEKNVTLPRPVASRAEARRLWVKDELSSRCNSAFWTMLGETVPDPIDKQIKDEARDIAA